MEMIMEYKISLDNKNFNKDDYTFDVGGYSFIVNGNEIPFDFEAFGYDIESDNEKVYLNYQSGRGFAFNEFDVDSCFDDEYKKLGLTRDDITAKFLSSTNKITEFYISLYNSKYDREEAIDKFKIDYIKFIDCITDEEFEVDTKVLEDFNKNFCTIN